MTYIFGGFWQQLLLQILDMFGKNNKNNITDKPQVLYSLKLYFRKSKLASQRVDCGSFLFYISKCVKYSLALQVIPSRIFLFLLY